MFCFSSTLRLCYSWFALSLHHLNFTRFSSIINFDYYFSIKSTAVYVYTMFRLLDYLALVEWCEERVWWWLMFGFKRRSNNSQNHSLLLEFGQIPGSRYTIHLHLSLQYVLTSGVKYTAQLNLIELRYSIPIPNHFKKIVYLFVLLLCDE